MPPCGFNVPSPPIDHKFFRKLASFPVAVIGAVLRRNGEILIISHDLSVWKYDTTLNVYKQWITNEQTQDEIKNGYDASKNCVAYNPQSDIIYITRDCELVKINLFTDSTQSVPLSFYFTKLVNNNPICTAINNTFYLFASSNTNRYLSYNETEKKFNNKCVLFEDKFTKTELNSNHRQIVYIKSQKRCIFLHNPHSNEVTPSTLTLDMASNKVMENKDKKYLLPKEWPDGHNFSCIITPDDRYILVFGYCAHSSSYHDADNYFNIPMNGWCEGFIYSLEIETGKWRRSHVRNPWTWFGDILFFTDNKYECRQLVNGLYIKENKYDVQSLPMELVDIMAGHMIKYEIHLMNKTKSSNYYQHSTAHWKMDLDDVLEQGTWRDIL